MSDPRTAALTNAFLALARTDQGRAIDVLLARIDEIALCQAIADMAGAAPIQPRSAAKSTTKRAPSPKPPRTVNAGRRAPPVGSEPLSSETVAHIRSMGTITDAGKAIGVRRPQLSEYVRGMPVSPRIRARIDEALKRIAQADEAAQVTSPSAIDQVRQRGALLGFDAGDLARSAGVDLDTARAALAGEIDPSACEQLLKWVDRDLVPDGHGGFALL